MPRKAFLPFLALAIIAGSSITPAFSQNRFMDQAREAAERRAENEAIRKAEHPDESNSQTARATPAPATQAAPAEAAPAAPETPAATPAH
jgi:hypothetical protein